MGRRNESGCGNGWDSPGNDSRCWGPNLPEFRTGGCALTLGGEIISAFGMRYPWGEMATMYVYDSRTDWWSRGPDPPIGLCYPEGTKRDNAAFSVGGREGETIRSWFRQ